VDVHERVNRGEERRRPERIFERVALVHEDTVEERRPRVKEDDAERDRGDGEGAQADLRRDVEVRRAFALARFAVAQEIDEVEVLNRVEGGDDVDDERVGARVDRPHPDARQHRDERRHEREPLFA